jgi:hypothetical protein
MTVGQIAISGYHPGSTIEVVPNAEAVTAESGLDVGFVRNRKYDKLAVATFKLLPGSQSNDVLQNLYNLDNNPTNPGGGIVPFFIRDFNFTGTYVQGLCWVMNQPALGGYSDESAGREWMLQIADYKGNISGGAQFFGAIGI